MQWSTRVVGSYAKVKGIFPAGPGPAYSSSYIHFNCSAVYHTILLLAYYYFILTSPMGHFQFGLFVCFFVSRITEKLLVLFS